MTDNQRKLRRDFEEETGGYTWHPWRWAAGAGAVVVGGYVLSAALGFAAVPFEIGKKVTNADNVIFQYEKFHDACAGIVALDGQHKTATDAATAFDKRTSGKPDPLSRNADESARLHTDANGLLQARQGAAQQYNADSRKLTQSLFKSKGLPYRIEDGVTPSCDG